MAEVTHSLGDFKVPVHRYDAEIIADTIGAISPDLRASILADTRFIGEVTPLEVAYIALADIVSGLNGLQAASDDEGVDTVLDEFFQGGIAQTMIPYPTLHDAQDAMFSGSTADKRASGRIVVETYVGVAALLLLAQQGNVTLPKTKRTKQLQNSLAGSDGLYLRGKGVNQAKLKQVMAELSVQQGRGAYTPNATEVEASTS